MLHDLQVLNLSWGSTPQEALHVASPGTLLKTVEITPCLEEPHLTVIRITLEELAAVLKCLGKRLRRFSTTISEQDENHVNALQAYVSQQQSTILSWCSLK